MNTDELCKTIEGLPDDAKLFRPNEPFALNKTPYLSTGLTGADLKALVREFKQMRQPDRLQCDDCGAMWPNTPMGTDALWTHCCQ